MRSPALLRQLALASLLSATALSAQPSSPAPGAPSAAVASSEKNSGAPASTASAESAVLGDWQGTLDVGGKKLRLAVHITRNDDGTLKSTFDSLDQGAVGLPVLKTSLEKGILRLDLGPIGARYEGTLNKEATAFAGTWTQGPGSFPLTLARQTAPPAGSGQIGKEGSNAAGAQETSALAAAVPAKQKASDPIKDTWMGELDAGGVKLRLAVHLTRSADGVLTATLDSLDQGAMGMSVDSASFVDGKLTMELKRLDARYDGTMNKEGTVLTGTWIQRGTSLPLVLKPVDKVSMPNRPQEPKRPLAYREEEVLYENKPAGVKLAGTLTLPKIGGPFPAVLLITGSGPEDRDETVFAHKPFFVLSDWLTRQGIAVLRVDDRGVGGSTAGSAGLAAVTTDDFVEDVLAGVAFLKGRKEIDPAHIGLVGHSEGGIIAPRAAIRSKDVAFIVMMAGPGLPGEQILHAQSALFLKSQGAPEGMVDEVHALNARIYGIVKEEKDDAAAGKRIRQELSSMPGMTPEAVDGQVKAVLSPWFRFFLTYDPRPTLAQVKVPALAIAGERDLQVPAKDNIAAIREALESAGHKDHSLVILPGLNHLFQECKTGSPTEYASIEQTFSPDAMKTVSDWILVHTKAH